MVAEFKHRKRNEAGEIEEVAPGATMKARVRKAFKLCKEAFTPSTTQAPTPAEVPVVTPQLPDLQAQLTALASTIAQQVQAARIRRGGEVVKI